MFAFLAKDIIIVKMTIIIFYVVHLAFSSQWLTVKMIKQNAITQTPKQLDRRLIVDTRRMMQ